jgi:hypothetical protein
MSPYRPQQMLPSVQARTVTVPLASHCQQRTFPPTQEQLLTEGPLILKIPWQRLQVNHLFPLQFEHCTSVACPELSGDVGTRALGLRTPSRIPCVIGLELAGMCRLTFWL